MKENLEEEIEKMEAELAQKKSKLALMQGAGEGQTGNISSANEVTGDVDYEKMKKKMFLSKLMG
jgi:hypothetical protein